MDEVDPGTPEEKERPERDDDESDSSGSDGEMDAILLAQLQRLAVNGPPKVEAREPVLESFDLEGIAKAIKAGKKKIIVMAGAGISVSAGIPDFRSPGTGLYANLQKYNLPQPEAVFDIDYFREKPGPFYMLAKELYPGQFCPTPTHCFIRLLNEKGVLQRCFTQNIDSLEVLCGLPEEKCVAAHGNFDKAHCIGTSRHEADTAAVKAAVERGEPARCAECGSLLKPDIVFFGEALPERFWTLSRQDFARCDLLLVMGTSLVVNPFASLIGNVKEDVPRALINREKAGEARHPLLAQIDRRSFNFGAGNYRDVFVKGDCDDVCRRLAELLGWGEDLEKIIAEVRGKFPGGKAEGGGSGGGAEASAGEAAEGVAAAIAKAEAAGAAEAVSGGGGAAAADSQPFSQREVR